MTPTEKRLILDRLEKFEETQDEHEKRLSHVETTGVATAELVADMESRMTAFEPVLAGMDRKLTILVREKEDRETAENAIRATPFAKFVSDLKKSLGQAMVLMISGFVVAAVVGLFLLLLKSGAFKALGWG